MKPGQRRTTRLAPEVKVEVEDPRMAKELLAALIMQCGGDVVIYPGDLARTNTRMKISVQPHPESGGILLRAFLTEEAPQCPTS